MACDLPGLLPPASKSGAEKLANLRVLYLSNNKVSIQLQRHVSAGDVCVEVVGVSFTHHR
jgi:hypothetical protein